MRLVDLDPRWIERDGRRIGFVFISPSQKSRADGTKNPVPYRQTCFVEHVTHREQREIFDRMFGDVQYTIQGCNPDCAWQIAGGIDAATFETMTVSPSLNGEAGGLWHGFIQNGQIIGGI